MNYNWFWEDINCFDFHSFLIFYLYIFDNLTAPFFKESYVVRKKKIAFLWSWNEMTASEVSLGTPISNLLSPVWDFLSTNQSNRVCKALLQRLCSSIIFWLQTLWNQGENKIENEAFLWKRKWTVIFVTLIQHLNGSEVKIWFLRYQAFIIIMHSSQMLAAAQVLGIWVLRHLWVWRHLWVCTQGQCFKALFTHLSFWHLWPRQTMGPSLPPTPHHPKRNRTFSEEQNILRWSSCPSAVTESSTLFLPRGLKACGLCFGLSHFCRVQFRYRIITVNHNFR